MAASAINSHQKPRCTLGSQSVNFDGVALDACERNKAVPLSLLPICYAPEISNRTSICSLVPRRMEAHTPLSP